MTNPNIQDAENITRGEGSITSTPRILYYKKLHAFNSSPVLCSTMVVPFCVWRYDQFKASCEKKNLTKPFGFFALIKARKVIVLQSFV